MELQDITVEVAGITWHLEARSFWEAAAFIRKNPDDPLARVASYVRTISAKGRIINVSIDEARAVISRLTSPQLIELQTAFDRVSLAFHFRHFNFSVPALFGEPHWKQARALEDRLGTEQRNIVETLALAAQAELQDEALMQRRVDENLDVVLRGLDKVNLEDELNPDEDQEPVYIQPVEKPSRSFVLADILNVSWPIITRNLFTVTGSIGDDKLVLRYLSSKELSNLASIIPDDLERERYFCAASIVSINNTWALKEFPPPPEVMAYVLAMNHLEVPLFYEVLLKIKSYVESMLPYVEAMPHIKITHDFWDLWKTRGDWWDSRYTGIPGTGDIPPNELIDTFAHECLIEERAVARMDADETLVMQIAGLSGELANNIQTKNFELHQARQKQINYILFNETPPVETKADGSFSVPGENSQEDLVNVAENAIKGKLDYHDLMVKLLQKRKQLLSDKMRVKQVETTPQATSTDAFEGGSHYASVQEIQSMHSKIKQIQQEQAAETLEFSLDVVDSISKTRRRALLVQGVDPYNETDQSFEWSPAQRITRTEEIK